MLALLATFTLISPSPMPIQADVTVLLREGHQLATGQVVTTVFSGPVFDRSQGGYFAVLRVDGGPQEIWHDPDGAGPLPLGFFHRPVAPPNETFRRATVWAAGGGKVAWRMQTRRVQLGIVILADYVMVDDSQVWHHTDPSPVAGTWWVDTNYQQMELTSFGELIFRNEIGSGSSSPYPIIVNLTTGEVVHEPGELIGTTGAVTSYVGTFRLSPSGNHLALRVGTVIDPCFNGTSINWLLLDGEPILLNGVPVRETMQIPAGSGSASGQRIETAYVTDVNDAGDVLLSLEYGVPCAFPTERAHFRNGQFLATYPRNADPYPSFLLTSGLVGTAHPNALDLDGEPLLSPTSTVDIDGDGAPDAGWHLADLQAEGSLNRGYRSDAADRIYARLRIHVQGSPPVTAFVSVKDRFQGQGYCVGVPNSTGRAAALTALGSDVASENELTLLANGMPSNSFGYALVSRTAGMVANPAGSQGTLCLAGDIGRFAASTFSSGSAGSSATAVDLTSLPQPMGSASAMAGDVWRFQVWYRDAIAGQATSNFSAAIAVTLQ